MKKTANLSPAQGKTFNPASFVRPGLSQAQVVEIKAAFDLFDTDQGGSVDTKQLKAAMVSLGFETRNATIFKMIVKLDEDGSGVLQFSQWLHLMTYKISPASSRASINKLFPLYDEQGKGFISVQNLKRIAEDLGLQVPEAELQQMINRADTDKDGVVSPDEFYTILTRPIKQ